MFRAPSKTPYKACGPKGSTGRPSTRHSRDESRAAQSETSAHTAQHATGSWDGCKCCETASGPIAKNKTPHGTSISRMATARIAMAVARLSKGVPSGKNVNRAG